MPSPTDISLVIPVYNGAGTLPRALASVFAQTVVPAEIIVVDDGSTDGSDETARRFGDRVRVVQQANAGVSAARNRGIAECTSELVAFLDADDEWMPEFLETIKGLVAAHPDCGMYGTMYVHRYADGTEIPCLIRGLQAALPRGTGVIPDYFRIASMSDPPICSSAVVVRRGLIDAVGGFPAGITTGEDLLTWARLAAHKPVAYSSTPLARFWQPADAVPDAVNRPARTPEEPDRVGHALRELLPLLPVEHRKGLRLYVGLWHKMRASCHVRFGRPWAACREFCLGLLTARGSPRFVALSAVSLQRLVSGLFRPHTRTPACSAERPCGPEGVLRYPRVMGHLTMQPDTSRGTPLVLDFISCYGFGATVTLANTALALMSELGEHLLCVSDDREQVDGILSDCANKGLQIRIVRGIDGHAHFAKHVTTFCRIAAEFRPDVVQVHTNWQLAIAAAARRRMSRPFRIGYWIHGFRHNSPAKAFFATVLIGGALAYWADFIIASSSVVARRFRFLGKRVRLLMIGVDGLFFGPYAPPPNAGPIRVVFPAQFRKGKNHDALIRAFARVGGNVESELVLPGEGPLRPACMALADELGLHDRASFPGQLDHKALLALLRSCHCAVVPTNYETFGSCIAEPLVLGRPVISRLVGCAADVITHGENGFLFRNDRELPSLLQVLLDSPDLRERMGRTAYERRDVFSWARIAAMYIDHIKPFVDPSAAGLPREPTNLT